MRLAHVLIVCCMPRDSVRVLTSPPTLSIFEFNTLKAPKLKNREKMKRSPCTVLTPFFSSTLINWSSRSAVTSEADTTGSSIAGAASGAGPLASGEPLPRRGKRGANTCAGTVLRRWRWDAC